MKLKAWWSAHKPSKRRLIQLYAALLFNANLKGFANGRIYKGPLKNLCTPGLNCYSCPGASGACPLGALQNALSSSNNTVPYYMLGILLLYGLLLARWICGFLCPFGLIQDLLYKIKTPKVGKSRVTRALSYLKYVILVFFVLAIPLIYIGFPMPGFCKYICPAGTLEGAVGLLSNPANANQMGMLGPLFTWKFLLMVGFLVGAVFIYRFFCRFFCPLGALYGLFNKLSLVGVKLDRTACTDCGLCESHCKMDIREVGDRECIMCGECMSVCPTGAIQWKGPRILLPPQAIGGEIATKGGGVSDVDSVSDAANAVETAQKAKSDKAKRRYLVTRIVTAIVLVGVLLGALYYYNFVDERDYVPPTAGNAVGDACLGLDLPLYNAEGVFNVERNPNKVTVINFWGTWCGPCIEELPHFDEVATTYADRVTVVAVHSNYMPDGDAHPTVWIPAHYPETGILFAQDPDDGAEGAYYTALGGTGTFPMTVIVNGEGVITFVRVGSLTYDELSAEVERALGN